MIAAIVRKSAAQVHAYHVFSQLFMLGPRRQILIVIRRQVNSATTVYLDDYED